MSKEEFLKLSDLDKVKYAIEESLKEHKGYRSEYWKGSAFMGESVLQSIEQVKKFAIADVSQCNELLAFEDWVNKNTTTALKDGIKLALENYKKANCG